MNVEPEDLYDYDALRRIGEATLFVVRTVHPVLVLGGNQSPDVLDAGRVDGWAVRRRRGGGGLVLLRPDDLWIDWWIPTHDLRWSPDVRASALNAGSWWRDTLAAHGVASPVVHEGPLEGDPRFRVVCFAGRGPGEVFVAGRKAVGLTQWRVREGVFLSSVLPEGRSADVLELLAQVPDGLAEALDHHDVASLALADAEGLVADLASAGGPWRVRQLLLTD